MPGRDGAGILEAATTGSINALVVGGVDAADLADPRAEEALAKTFVVSLDFRPSSVTAVADVVLPVAPQAEKGGTFVDWEGRPRSFEAALDTAALSDYRVLDMLASEMGAFLGTRTLAEIRREMTALGPWTGERRGAPTAPRGRPPERRRRSARARHLAPPARPRLAAGRRAVPGRHRSQAPCPVSAATAEAFGLVDGEVVTVATAARLGLRAGRGHRRHGRPRRLAPDQLRRLHRARLAGGGLR